MFGMGFMEIFLIAVVAIIALGPEKLPSAMVDIAKFFKKFKSSIDDAKSTLDNELNIAEMKEEAAKYKAQIEDAKRTLNVKESLDLGLNDIINDDMSSKENKKSDDEKEEKLSLKEDSKDSKPEDKKVEKKKSKKEDKPSKELDIELEDVDGLEEIK